MPFRISYLEIYNEKVNDLLCAEHTDMKVREDRDGNHFVESKEEVASNPGQVFALMRQGNKNRKVGCTDMNERSSRSHTIFKIVSDCLLLIVAGRADIPMHCHLIYLVTLAYCFH